MTVKRNHLYGVIYKGKFVANYSWREPLNKEGWVLVDEEHYCPLPTNYLKQLVNDNDIELVDLGAI